MFKTFLLLFALTMFFILIGRILGKKKGMVIAFIVALVFNGFSYWFSDTIILKAYRVKPAPPGHRLERITRSLVKKAGLPMPKVYIIPSKSPNAFATGRNPQNAAVAATEGILTIMDDRELTAVMAHELGHVKNRDTLISTVAASISGGVFILSRVALFFGGSSRRSWGARLAVSILAPIAAGIITMAISRDREYAADAYSAGITGRPMDLAGALVKLTENVRRNPMPDNNPQTAHLFIVHPFSGLAMSEIFSTHPPVEKRVNRLSKMKGAH